DAVRPDLDRGRLALVARVLGRQADPGEGIDDRAGADPRMALDHGVALDDDAVLEHHVRPDRRERADANARAEPGAVLDDGGRMDVRHAYSSAIKALMVASATFTPPTIASASNFQMLVRWRTLRT